MQSLAAAAANDMSGFAAGSLGDLPPPSPPAEKATARQNQARESGSCVGTGNARPTRLRCFKQKRADRGQASTLVGSSRRGCLQATSFRRRRAKASRPPQAAIRPGKPAPTMGPGTLTLMVELVEPAVGAMIVNFSVTE
jgi:hypothetical protein